MSKTLYDRLAPLATRRVAALLMVVFLVLTVVVFPNVINRLNTLAGRELGLIDTQFSYTPVQVYQMTADYGPEGRPLYILTALTADVLYPLDYALLMALLILMTFRQAFPASRLAFLLVWVPFIAAVFDLLENAGIVTLLATFPHQWSAVAGAASMCTSLKWIFLALALLLVAAGFVGLLVTRLRQ